LGAFRKIFLKALLSLLVLSLSAILLNSSLDLYNDFVYDKAIIKENPYGYTPMLKDVHNYSSGAKNIRSGDFVYVEDWLSAHNGRLAFAKVRSKFDWGYINKDLLVETNINIIPPMSALMLLLIIVLSLRVMIRNLTEIHRDNTGLNT